MKKWFWDNWKTMAIWTWLILFLWGVQLTIIYNAIDAGTRFIGG